MAGGWIITGNLFLDNVEYFLDMCSPKGYNFSRVILINLFEGTDQPKGEEHGF
jgi:hypothetical protein